MEKRGFSRTYLIVNEVCNAVTHGIGAGLSIAGLVILLIKGVQLDSPLHIVSYAIYGSMMILLFLTSTLFHSLIFTKAKKVFQVFDHSSIFLLIAGSYTPFCLLSVKGWLGWTLFALIWLFAIAGIVYKSLTLHKKEKVSKISTLIYIIMGWLCLIAAVPLYHSLGPVGVSLLVLGGVSYTVGAFFYSLNSIRFMHVVWHLFVMLGAGFMYFSVLFYT
ncbi:MULTISPECIES: PAQR family membrane homeostasis protein TrhA [unclassified Enterococcus]|jgi:hemolysin III|uniref:PAQR family membrane homeostasis protein TrhA n=1 Tax=unclassified Enterococcus TaxID=2608891 RepID=UPI0003533456|nr:channel protein, hemolysin III family [Enterococcus faecalis 13-SD-W-01]